MFRKVLPLLLCLLASAWFIAPRPAQAATCTSNGSGNWSTLSWLGCTPGASDDVIIASGHTVTLDIDVTVQGITIESGATFNNGSSTLTAANGYLTNNGTYNGDSGTYNFTALNGIFGTSQTIFNNVSTNNGVDFGNAPTPRAAVNGRFTINAGGYVANNRPPIYNDGSTLHYNSGGTYGRFDEWQAGSSGIGVPYHVEIGSGTTLNVNAPRTARGDVIVAGTLNLGNNIGDDLVVHGDFMNNGGTFNANSRLVTLAGNGKQIGGSTDTTFAFLTIPTGADITVRPGTAVSNAFVNNGAIRQTRTVNNATVEFLNLGGYGGVHFTTSNNLGSTNVVIRGNQACDTNNSAVRRCFDITPQFNVATDITFFYTDAEINGSSCAAMNVYRWMGLGWQATTTGSTNCASNPRSVTITGQTNFSPFALRSGGFAPTAVTMQNITATHGNFAIAPFVLFLLLVAATGGYMLHRRHVSDTGSK